jgi:hypothetical protein
VAILLYVKCTDFNKNYETKIKEHKNQESMAHIQENKKWPKAVSMEH